MLEKPAFSILLPSIQRPINIVASVKSHDDADAALIETRIGASLGTQALVTILPVYRFVYSRMFSGTVWPKVLTSVANFVLLIPAFGGSAPTKRKPEDSWNWIAVRLIPMGPILLRFLNSHLNLLTSLNSETLTFTQYAANWKEITVNRRMLLMANLLTTSFASVKPLALTVFNDMLHMLPSYMPMLQNFVHSPIEVLNLHHTNQMKDDFAKS